MKIYMPIYAISEVPGEVKEQATSDCDWINNPSRGSLETSIKNIDIHSKSTKYPI